MFGGYASDDDGCDEEQCSMQEARRSGSADEEQKDVDLLSGTSAEVDSPHRRVSGSP